MKKKKINKITVDYNCIYTQAFSPSLKKSNQDSHLTLINSFLDRLEIDPFLPILQNPDLHSSSKFPIPTMSVQSVITNNVDQKQKPFRFFVGYDTREDLAYEVCRYSILKRSSIPVEIIPIKQSQLRDQKLFWRERNKLESTEFSFTRFLTPYLAGYEGWAVFVDCDFLYLSDVKELYDLIDEKYAVMCVQHDYTPKESTKMDGAVQTVYPRKNWSSMVLYNCGHPKNKALSPEIVNKESGAYLHRFMWLDDEDIGEVPFVWNFLVGHNHVVDGDVNTYPKAIHYTSGGPWFEAWKNCEFADLWLKELDEYRKVKEKEKYFGCNGVENGVVIDD